MKNFIGSVTAAALLICAASGGTAQAQQEQQASFIYSTYFKCDVTLQERADEIMKTRDKPIWDAAVSDGTVASWGWLVHHTGGSWRRAMYFQAASIEALLAAQKKLGDQADAKDKKLGTEFGKICNSHDDYIWRGVAGAGNQGARGGASFSVYYVCDQTREDEADALVKQVFAPVYDKLIASGALKSWGWNEHIVGGQYRRLATLTATDVPALVKARTAVVEAMVKNPLSRTFDDICGSHSDYIWEIQAETP